MVNLSLQSFKVPKQMANGTIYVWWFENFSQKYTSTLHQAKCHWQLLKCYFLQKYRLANKSHIELAIAKLFKKIYCYFSRNRSVQNRMSYLSYYHNSKNIWTFTSCVNNCSFCKVFKSCESKSSISANTFQIFVQSFGIS